MGNDELIYLAESQDKKLTTSEKHTSNDFYGHATILKKYLGVSIDQFLPVAIEHGAQIRNFCWDVDLNTTMPNFLCTSKSYIENVWSKKSNIPALPIGPLIHYAPIDFELTKRIKGNYDRVLIVFPHHSTHHITIDYDSIAFCDQIDNLKNDFDKIYICMFWKDIIQKKHEYYINRGYECITAGHMFNPDFLIRLKSYLTACTAIATSSLGTQVGYSIYLNKRVIYLPSASTRNLHSNVPHNPTSVTYLGESVDSLAELFKCDYGLITPQQYEVANRYWGLDQIKTIEELLMFMNLYVAIQPINKQEVSEIMTKNNPNILNEISKAVNYLQNGNYDEAMNITNTIKSYKSAYKNLDFIRAVCFFGKNQLAGAKQAVLEELRYFPDNSDAIELLKQLEKQNEPDQISNYEREFQEVFYKVKNYTMLSIERLYSLYVNAKAVCQKDLPGDFAECGVAAGGSSALLAYVIKKYSKRLRKLYSCDSFEGMPEPTNEDSHQGTNAQDTGWGTGTCSAPDDSLLKICKELCVENQVEIVKGYFNNTLPILKSKINNLAFLHMDGDWYESTKDILNNLYDKVINNGFIQIDDYGFWDGCRKAVTEFEQVNGLKFELNKIDSTGVWLIKSVALIKEELVMLNLGCGNRWHEEWQNYDFVSNSPMVKACNLSNGIPLAENSCDIVYHSHILEHFSKSKSVDFIRECYRVLKPRGVIRVVVPDLEKIAEEYLKNLRGAIDGDSVATEKYDWTILEMYDQTVRNISGGEMLKHWLKDPLPQKDYIIERMGSEVKNVLNEIVRNRANYLNQPTEESLSDEQIGKFRRGGEIHQWMYDRFSLSRLLTNAGFRNIRLCEADESRITKFNSYLLDIESDGNVRKPDSLFMEAEK